MIAESAKSFVLRRRPPDPRKPVGAYEFRDYGIEHAQYFPGAGTIGTHWDAVFVGVGDTPVEAANDALDQAAEDWQVSSIEVPPELGASPSVSAKLQKEAQAEVEAALNREDYESDEEYAESIEASIEDYLEQGSELGYYVLLFLREWAVMEGSAKDFFRKLALRLYPAEWPKFNRWSRREAGPGGIIQSRRAFVGPRSLRNTRFYKYPGQRYAVRFHATDVLFYDADGNAHVRVGPWMTNTSRDRINTFAPHGWRLEQAQHKWWWYNVGWPEHIRALRRYPHRKPIQPSRIWIPFTNADIIAPDGKLITQNGTYDPHNPVEESVNCLLPPLSEGHYLDKLDWIMRVRAKHKAMREAAKRFKDLEDLKKPRSKK